MSVGEFISDARHRFQRELLPFLANQVGPPGETHRRFVAVLDPAPVERRFCYDRDALARALLAKAVWNLPTTRALIDRPHYDPTPRAVRPVAAFRRSRASRRSPVPLRGSRRPGFQSGCTGRLSGPLIRARSSGTSRDSTAIVGRERPVREPTRPGGS